MRSIIDLTGQRFGTLLVLGQEGTKRIGQKNQSYVAWHVRCDCGVEKTVLGSNLKQKTRPVRSCGCSYTPHLKPGIAAANALLRTYKRNARTKGLVWEILASNFFELVQKECHYCGQAPSAVQKPNESTNGVFVYNGLDRMDPHQGYVETNVVPCCKSCNWAKGSKSYTEFMTYIHQLVQFQTEKQTSEITVDSRSIVATAA